MLLQPELPSPHVTKSECGQVTLGAELGQGSFGTTFRGTWRGGDLAVKRVRISKPEEATSFLREVSSLACLRHPNIMPFIGECCPAVLSHGMIDYSASAFRAACAGTCV